MRGKRELKKSLKSFSKEKVSNKNIYYGELGITLGGSQVVDVPGRTGFVFVRIRGNTSELIQALNDSVPSAYGVPVIIQRQGQNYKIVGRDVRVYANQGTQVPGGVYPLPRHGGQHSFAPELNLGADVSWIFSRQFMPMLTYPSGTSMLLTINPHFYEWNGSWRYAQNSGSVDFTPYIPTITGSARMALLYITPSDNGLKIAAGSPFSNDITSPSQLAQYIPDVDRDTSIPLAAVKLPTGTTSLGWNNIYDMRDFYTVSKGWAGIGIQDDGVPLGTGTILNFNNNLSASISNGVVTINGTAGGGGGNGVVAWDEGIFLGTGTILNFVGPNVEASISGSVIRVFVTGSSGGGSTSWLSSEKMIVDNLTPQATGSNTNFNLLYSMVSGTSNLFYNGIRQKVDDHYTVGAGLNTIATLFTPASPDTLIAVYEVLTSGSVSGGGGGGAPTTTKYVVTESDASLSSEIVIPGLAGSADMAGSNGAGVSYEFDSGASPLTWSAAVDTETVNSTFASHLYVQDDGASETLGTFAYAPAGAFDLRCKIAFGVELGTSASSPSVALIVGDSAMNNRVLIMIVYDGSTDTCSVRAFTYAGSYTQRGSTNNVGVNEVYLRIVRDGSNNNSFYYSMNGLVWNLIATQSLTYTAAKAGLRLDPSSLTCNVAVDWIRSNV